MRLTSTLSGDHADQSSVHLRGIVQFKLAPQEQKPFAYAITRGLPNFFVRGSQTVLRWLPSFVIGYLVYRWVEEEHYKSKRKNPDDYAAEPPPKKDPICFQVDDQFPPGICKEDVATLPPECRGEKGPAFEQALKEAKEYDAAHPEKFKKKKKGETGPANKVGCEPPAAKKEKSP